MFDSVVDRYDLVNGLLSFGLDRWWRRKTAGVLAALPEGSRVLDLGCGTGKLGGLLVPRARVVGIDLSHRMLASAAKAGRRLDLIRGSVFALPFADSSFQGATSGFVLRNLDDLQAAFDELARVVLPGGRIAIVDITGPRSRLLRKPFNLYFGTVAPLLGRLVGEGDAYRYLAGSLAQLPQPRTVCMMFEQAGFTGVRARPLSFGMVTLWTGTRSRL